MKKFDLITKTQQLIDIFINYQGIQIKVNTIDSHCSYEVAKSTSDITHIIAGLSGLNIEGVPPEHFLYSPEKNNINANKIIATNAEYQNKLNNVHIYGLNKNQVQNWAKEKYGKMKNFDVAEFTLKSLENACFKNWCSWYIAYSNHEVKKEVMQENLIHYCLLGFHRKVSLEKFFDKAKSIYNEYINVEKT